MKNMNTRITSTVKLVAGTLLFLASAYFIWLNRKFYTLTPEALGKYLDVKWLIIGHIAGGAVALLTGPPLLWAKFRNRYLHAHRALGKVYIMAILTGGSCALYLTSTTAWSEGWAYVLSLYVLAGLWVTAAGLAWYFVRIRKMRLHEDWTKRSYIVTVAFIAQNFLMYHPLVQGLGSFAETAPSVIWFSWSVPFVLFDIYRSFGKKSR